MFIDVNKSLTCSSPVFGIQKSGSTGTFCSTTGVSSLGLDNNLDGNVFAIASRLDNGLLFKLKIFLNVAGIDVWSYKTSSNCPFGSHGDTSTPGTRTPNLPKSNGSGVDGYSGLGLTVAGGATLSNKLVSKQYKTYPRIHHVHHT